MGGHPTLTIGPLEVSVDQAEGTVMVSLAGQGLALVVVPAICGDLAGEDAGYWIHGHPDGGVEPVPPSKYLIAAWPDGEGFQRLYVGDLGVGPDGAAAGRLAAEATAALQRAALAPYRTFLQGAGIAIDADRYGAAVDQAVLYGALIAAQASSALDPLDHEGEFWPAADAGFGQVAQLVADTLAAVGAVIPRQVAFHLAAGEEASHLAAVAHAEALAPPQANPDTAAGELVRAWAELAQACAIGWLRGVGGNPDELDALAAAAGLDGAYAESAAPPEPQEQAAHRRRPA
jgi:hypothetical protein